MKVLFIQPYISNESIAGDDTSMFEPLALEYLSGNIKDICETRLLDMRIEKRLNDCLDTYRPDVVGITSYTVHVNVVKSIIKEIKEFDNGIKIVVGGHHASVSPADFIDVNPDYIVKGEGIIVFRQIVEVLKGNIRINELESVEIDRLGSTIILKSIEEVPIGSFPYPDRVLSEKYRKEYFSYWMKPIASLRSSSGCKFRCSFCSLWERYNGRYYTRKPESVVEELKTIKEDIIYFSDDESFLDSENVNNLADLIRKSGIKKRYHMLVRADSVVKNKDILAKWKDIGLERVFIGMESAKDEFLKKINKGTSVKINEEAVKYLQNLGITVISDFIIDQEFDRSDFKKLRDYVRKLKLSSPVFTILTPLPGTRFYKENENQIIDKKWEHYDVMHTVLKTKLPIREFYKEFYRIYKNSASFFKKIEFISQFSFIDIVKIIKLYGNVLKKIKCLITR
jgi:hopanoid C-3 methylase